MNTPLPTGKLPGKVLDQEIIDHVRKATRDELIDGPGVGKDCAVIQMGSGYCVASMDPITGATAEAGVLAVQVTANDIAASGVEPLAIFLTILVPPGTTTRAISELVQQAAATAQGLNIAIAGGHTEVTSAVTRPVLVTTGLGYTESLMDGFCSILPGDHLFISKAIAIEGTAILAADFSDILRQKSVSAETIERGKDLAGRTSVVKDGITARACGALAMHDATEGGIWGAVEEMCVAANCGVLIDQTAIPILPESLEICQALGVDPYCLLSSGAMLVAVRGDAADFKQTMGKAGVEVTLIGEFVAENKNVRLPDGGIVPLSAPDRDEIYRILEILSNEEAEKDA